MRASELLPEIRVVGVGQEGIEHGAQQPLVPPPQHLGEHLTQFAFDALVGASEFIVHPHRNHLFVRHWGQIVGHLLEGQEHYLVDEVPTEQRRHDPGLDALDRSFTGAAGLAGIGNFAARLFTDHGLDAAVPLVERRGVLPGQPFVDQGAGSRAEQERPDVVRVATDDRAGEHDHFLDGRDQRSERALAWAVFTPSSS